MTSIVVFGASGPTGQQLVEQGLERGHHVTALVRDRASIAFEHDRLTVEVGDVFDPDTVARLIAGKDALLSALGVKVGLTGAPHTTLYSDSAKSFVTAMKRTGVRRLVFCTSGGVEDHDPSSAWIYEHVVKPLLLQRGYDDMKIAEAVLWGTDLDWVVVRPTQLLDAPRSGTYRVSPRFAPAGGTQISRADLADFMLTQTRSDEWLRRTPTLAY